MNVLETERVVVRPTEPEDVDAIVALWTDPDVMRYMNGPRDPDKVRAAVVKLLARPVAERTAAYLIWSVIAKDSGLHLGDAGLIEKDIDGTPEVEVVYMLHREYWGRGFATEVATALVEHALGPRDRPRVVALIDPENTVSARVAEKAGLAFDRETIRKDGRTMRVYVRERVGPAAS